MYIYIRVKYHYSCQILMKLGILGQLSKATQISNFMKIPSVGAELFQTDEETTDGRKDRRTDGQTQRQI
jgi:hypothetical protein